MNPPPKPRQLFSILAAVLLAGCALQPTAASETKPTSAATSQPSPTPPEAVVRASSPTPALTATVQAGAPHPTDALWAANEADGNLLVIDPADNSVAVIIPTGIQVSQVAVGESFAWAIDPSRSALIQVDTDTYSILQVLRFPNQRLDALAVGLGAVWLGVTEQNGPLVLQPKEEVKPQGGILKIDPGTGKTLGYAKGGPVSALAAGQDSIWALASGPVGTPLERIDPVSLKITRLSLAGTNDWLLEDALAASQDSLWLFSGGFGKLYRTSLDGRLYSETDLGQHKPVGPASLLEMNGAVWLATPWGSVVRIDPTTAKVNAEIDLESPVERLAGAGGAVWAISTAAAIAFRIDPQTNAVVAQVPLGSRIQPTPWITPTAIQRATRPCEDAPSSRLAVGMRAVTPTAPALPNRLHKEAGKDKDVSGYIQPGQHVTIVAGPACADGWVWWSVKDEENGANGWAAEGDDSQYWLIPVR